jgi:dTDP-4-dehydrorhamnose 3,5-epimerase
MLGIGIALPPIYTPRRLSLSRTGDSALKRALESQMLVTKMDIAEVLLLEPRKFGDSRGFFSEVFNAKLLSEHVGSLDFVQDNHSLSQKKGTLRGIHFQAPPFAQDKLVRCVRGSILDIAVDLRRGSPTFGKSVTAELSADNWRQLFVPKGFGHAFLTLCEDVEVIYKVSDYYAPEHDGGIIWNDPDLAIAWGLGAHDKVELSAKDALLPLLENFETPFVFETLLA